MGLLDSVLGAGASDQVGRLGPAAYTSPSGNRIEYLYESFDSSHDARGKVNQFPGLDGQYVQSLGRSGKSLPVTMIFAGPNCDLQCSAMQEALDEPGIGTLEHPVFGKRDVVPVGTIKRSDRLVDGVGEVLLEVPFFETLRGVYPDVLSVASADVLSAYDAFLAAQASSFAKGLKTPTVAALLEAKADFRSTMKAVSRTMRKASAAITDAQAPFASLERDINLGLDTLIGQPLQLAGQVQTLIATPGSALFSVSTRFAAYQSQVLSLLGHYLELVFGVTSAPRSGTSTEYRAGNVFASHDLSVCSAVTAAAVTAAGATHPTRDHAVAAAAAVVDLHTTARAWRETQLQTVGEDNGVGSAMAATVRRAASLALRQSFDLPKARRIQLTRDRTLLDLSAELCGDIETGVDDLIAANRFADEELLLLRRGRVVTYYV